MKKLFPIFLSTAIALLTACKKADDEVTPQFPQLSAKEQKAYEESQFRDYCINMKVSISRIGGELPEGCEEVLEELKSRGKP